VNFLLKPQMDADGKSTGANRGNGEEWNPPFPFSPFSPVQDMRSSAVKQKTPPGFPEGV
jgi:hypothetical protein